MTWPLSFMINIVYFMFVFDPIFLHNLVFPSDQPVRILLSKKLSGIGKKRAPYKENVGPSFAYPADVSETPLVGIFHLLVSEDSLEDEPIALRYTLLSKALVNRKSILVSQLHGILVLKFSSQISLFLGILLRPKVDFLVGHLPVDSFLFGHFFGTFYYIIDLLASSPLPQLSFYSTIDLLGI